MGKDDFLKLLMTQLKHQDPLNPMDQKDFSAQLAQFSSLEQLSNIGSGIKDLRSGIGDETKLNGMAMIGKTVQASGNEVELVSGQPVNLKIDTGSGDVQPTRVSIYDGGGKLVRDLALDKNLMSGDIAWDGKTQEGMELPSGRYTFRVAAVDRQGQPREINPELTGRVTGVDLGGKEAVLLVQTARGQSRIEMSKIHHVSAEGPPGNPAAPGMPAMKQAMANPIPGQSVSIAKPEGDDDEAKEEAPVAPMGAQASAESAPSQFPSWMMPGADIQNSFSRE